MKKYPKSEDEILEWACEVMDVADTYYDSITEVYEDFGVQSYAELLMHINTSMLEEQFLQEELYDA